MQAQNHTFPWGTYIGDLINNNNTIPLCLDSQEGGFCLFFDQSSEQIANRFIENFSLSLFEVLPVETINVKVFDFGKKRFMHLSSLENLNLYEIAYSPKSSVKMFDEIEELSLYRHHQILSIETPTISQYNKESDYVEPYSLLLLNLEDFTNSIHLHRIKNFLDSAYQAGFYVIGFGDKNLIRNHSENIAYFFKKFHYFLIENQKMNLLNTPYKFINVLEKCHFKYSDINQKEIVTRLISQVKQENDTLDEQEFISIPIGRSANGREELLFTLGDKSKNFHAFITGVTGSGKTTLLNNIILGIAQNYTSDEIQLYLMDYKQGIEFQVFKNHPNCKKIFLDNEDIQASVQLLEEFKNTIRNRKILFFDKEVTNITDYNKVSKNEPMPRIILIIDEVHRLFTGSYKEQEYFTSILEYVLQQGRSFGVHIILSTQTLAGTSVNKNLMSHIALRISYRLVGERDCIAIFDSDNYTDARKLGNYELIYNPKSGQKEGNLICKSHPPKDVKQIINEIRTTRESHLMLTPELIMGQPLTPDSSSMDEALKKENLNKYSTNSEEEWLNKLRERGVNI